MEEEEEEVYDAKGDALPVEGNATPGVGVNCEGEGEGEDARAGGPRGGQAGESRRKGGKKGKAKRTPSEGDTNRGSSPSSDREAEGEVRSKAVADMMEALIGCLWENRGEEAAAAVMAWMGMPAGMTGFEERTAGGESRGSAAGGEAGVTAEAAGRRHGGSDDWMDEVEAGLGYRFNDRRLLVEALTHPSYCDVNSEECPKSYQVGREQEGAEGKGCCNVWCVPVCHRL